MGTTLTMTDAALEYAKAGLPVIPIHTVSSSGMCSCGNKACRAPGKHPRTKNGLDDATTNAVTIKRWWGDWWPNASVAGVCGKWLCVDVDPKNDGFTSLAELEEGHGRWPKTASVLTGDYDGERGRHYWFHVPDDYGDPPSTRVGIRDGIDIRCARGYALLPPSLHASGVRYEWEHGTFGDAVNAPAWLLQLVPVYVEGDSHWTPIPGFQLSKDVKRFLAGSFPIDPGGGQRDFLIRAARAILTTGKDVETTALLLWEGSEGSGGVLSWEWQDDYPWREEEMYEIAENVYNKPPSTPLEKDFSTEELGFEDASNGLRLVKSAKDGHLVYTPQNKHWYIWDTATERFIPDDGTLIHLRWLEVTDHMAMTARTRLDDTGKALDKHARGSRMRPRIEAAVSEASYLVSTPLTKMDADETLFAVENGVIDLRSGELVEELPSDLITMRSPVEYLPGARSRLFEAFLERVVPDPELRNYLQLAIGYTLTGNIEEHAFFYVYGTPASGKTTLLETLQYVTGSYGTKAQTATFMRQASRAANASSDDLARLAGKRFVHTSEVEKGERLATSLVNELVGGDMISARFMYSPIFMFRPEFKLWFGANELPRAAESARSGIWRRVKVIPFNESIPPNERNPRLPRRLRSPEHASAFLAWAVEGARRWYELHDNDQLLTPPQAVAEQTQAYEHESEHTNIFIEEALVVTDNPKDRVSTRAMYDAYDRWCKLEGRRAQKTRHMLTRTLGELGFVKRNARVDGKAQEAFAGVQVKPEYTPGITVSGPKRRRKS